MSRRAIAGAFFLLLSAAAPPARSHDGHTDRAPWDACVSRSLGAQCSWENDAHDLHVGTCRNVSRSLVCVRRQPVIPAAEARVEASPAGSEGSPRGAEAAWLLLLVAGCAASLVRRARDSAPGARP